jgi:chemotaxis protein histidine kinase CheA
MSEAAAAPAPAAAPSSSAPSGKNPSESMENAPSGKIPAQNGQNPSAGMDKAPAEEKITIKINGKLRTMSRDEATRELQKGIAAREKFEKAASLTQKNQQLLRALQDPDINSRLLALQQLGVDPDQIAEHRLQARAKQAQMTPEQQRIAELEAKLADGEKSQKEAAERAEREAIERQDKEIWSKTEAEYIAEIDKAVASGQLTGIPPAEALYLMAEAAEMNLEYGLDLPAAELIAEAKAKVDGARQELQQKVLGSLDGDGLLEFLGPDVVKKVAAAAVRKFKAGSPIQQLQQPAPIADPEQKQERPKWIRPSDTPTRFF